MISLVFEKEMIGKLLPNDEITLILNTFKIFVLLKYRFFVYITVILVLFISYYTI